MKNKIRLILNSIIILILVLSISNIVSATTYTILNNILRITNDTATSYTNYPWIATVANSSYINYGALDADGLNGQVYINGETVPTMVTDAKTLFYTSINGYSGDNDLQYTTTDIPNTVMPIIAGYNGYITTADAAALEPGTSFSAETSGYLNTTAGSGNIFSKSSSISLGVDGSTSGKLNATYNYSAASAYFSQTGGSTITDITSTSYMYSSNFTPSVACTMSTIDVQCHRTSPNTTGITLSIRATSDNLPTGANLVSGNFSTTSDSFVWLNCDLADYTFTAGTTYALCVTLYNTPPVTIKRNTGVSTTLGGYSSDGGSSWVAGYPFNYSINIAAGTITASTTGISSGSHISKLTLSSSYFKLYVDDVEKASSATGGLGVTNTSYSWIFGSIATPYFDYIKLTVSSTEVLKYQPNTIISGTTLPDRDTGDGTQNGTITWGTNPLTVNTYELPIITTGGSSDLTYSSVVLQGNLTSLGDFTDGVYVYFQYGTDQSFASNTTTTPWYALTEVAAYTYQTSISASSTYYYRFCAQYNLDNDYTIVYGQTVSFSSPSSSEQIPPSPMITQSWVATDGHGGKSIQMGAVGDIDEPDQWWADQSAVSSLPFFSIFNNGAISLNPTNTYTTGTATFTTGSNIITGSGTNWVSTMNGGTITDDSEGISYEISSVVNTTHIIIGSNYNGTTGSGRSYTVHYGGRTTGVLYQVSVFATAMAAGYGVLLMSGSPILSMIVMVCILGIGSSMTIISGWEILVVIIILLGIWLLPKFLGG